jgi:hypothetical protein
LIVEGVGTHAQVADGQRGVGGVAAGDGGTGDGLGGVAAGQDLARAGDVGAPVEGVAAAGIGVGVVAGDGDAVGTQRQAVGALPLCVSVPTVLAAPTLSWPAPVISAVPVPLKAALALTTPPLAASVPALASALLMLSVPPATACIRPPAALLTGPVMAIVSARLWLAVIVPWLTSARPVPAPNWPEPRSVCPHRP